MATTGGLEVRSGLSCLVGVRMPCLAKPLEQAGSPILRAAHAHSTRAAASTIRPMDRNGLCNMPKLSSLLEAACGVA